MKLAWITEKCLDTSVDHATWTEMTRLLAARGHDVRLFAGFRQRRELFGLGDRLRYLPSIKRAGLGWLSVGVSMFFLLFWICFIQRPDVILVHPFAFTSFWFYAWLRRFRLIRSKFVLDIRTLPIALPGWRGRFEAWEFEKALNLARDCMDGITVITPFMKKQLVDQYRLDPSRVGVWTSGAPEAWLETDAESQAQGRRHRQALGLEKAFIVFYHGTMIPNRGLDHLLLAFDEVRSELADAHLIYLGGGPARAGLEQMSDTLDCRSRVHFLGPVPHTVVRSYVAMADIGAVPLPDRMEWRVSSPIKLMEYLALGKPVILSDIEAHRDVVGERPLAFFHTPGDVGNLAEAIRKAHAHRRHLLEWGEEGRNNVAAQYTWTVQAEKLEAFLEAV